MGLWPQALGSVNENRHRSYLGYQEAAKPTRGPTTERVQLAEGGRPLLMVGFTEGGVEPCGRQMLGGFCHHRPEYDPSYPRARAELPDKSPKM